MLIAARSFLLLGGCAAGVTLVGGIRSAAAAPCQEIEAVTKLGERVALGKDLPADGTFERLSHPLARHLRALIELEAPGSGPWYVTIRDGQFHAVETLGRGDFERSAKRWTSRIPGSVALFDLDARGAAPPKLVIQEYIEMPANVPHPYYSSKDPAHPGWGSLYEASDLPPKTVRYGDAVGFLMSSWERDSWCCSGVMIAPDLFLTNWHCGGIDALGEAGYWNQQVCDSTLIDLSWDDDGLSREYFCTRVVINDHALDFAVLQVKALGEAETARPAIIRGAALEADAEIMVIHHPACRQKQITHDCKVRAAEHAGWFAADGGSPALIDFTHTCDTERGSSGAPIFDSGGRLVGLQHLGYDVDVGTCTAKDDVNKAVRLDAILAFLRDHAPEVIGSLTVQ